MTFTIVVHDTIALAGSKRRSSIFCPRRPEPAPIPPSLVNSPYLSPHSVFQRKIELPKWPSHHDNEWLRDMVPLDRVSPSADADAKSEGSHDPTPSPTSSDSSFGCSLFPPSSSFFPPSPLLRPRATTPVPDGAPLPPPAKRAPCGSGAGPSPHT